LLRLHLLCFSPLEPGKALLYGPSSIGSSLLSTPLE
jgi:hypothetical protein